MFFDSLFSVRIRLNIVFLNFCSLVEVGSVLIHIFNSQKENTFKDASFFTDHLKLTLLQIDIVDFQQIK